MNCVFTQRHRDTEKCLKVVFRSPLRKDEMTIKDPKDRLLREHVLYLLNGGGAHARFDDTVKNLPEEVRGLKPRGLPHSAWMLVEHLRLAQWDILEFSRNAKHASPEWPNGYWPQTEAPPSAAAWNKSVQQFRKDLNVDAGPGGKSQV